MDGILIELYFLIMIVALIFRGILFHAREEKWYKTLIPGYNKYILGKLSNSKKLGIASAVLNIITRVYFWIYLSLEIYMIKTYTKSVKVDNGESVLVLDIPQDWLTWMPILAYILIIIAFVTFVLYIIMMRKFSIINGKSSWWMFVWALCPLFGYIYFSVINKTIYIPNKGLCERSIVYNKRR